MAPHNTSIHTKKHSQPEPDTLAAHDTGYCRSIRHPHKQACYSRAFYEQILLSCTVKPHHLGFFTNYVHNNGFQSLLWDWLRYLSHRDGFLNQGQHERIGKHKFIGKQIERRVEQKCVDKHNADVADFCFLCKTKESPICQWFVDQKRNLVREDASYPRSSEFDTRASVSRAAEAQEQTGKRDALPFTDYWRRAVTNGLCGRSLCGIDTVRLLILSDHFKVLPRNRLRVGVSDKCKMVPLFDLPVADEENAASTTSQVSSSESSQYDRSNNPNKVWGTHAIYKAAGGVSVKIGVMAAQNGRTGYEVFCSIAFSYARLAAFLRQRQAQSASSRYTALPPQAQNADLGNLVPPPPDGLASIYAYLEEVLLSAGIEAALKWSLITRIDLFFNLFMEAKAAEFKPVMKQLGSLRLRAGEYSDSGNIGLGNKQRLTLLYDKGARLNRLNRRWATRLGLNSRLGRRRHLLRLEYRSFGTTAIRRAFEAVVEEDVADETRESSQKRKPAQDYASFAWLVRNEHYLAQVVQHYIISELFSFSSSTLTAKMKKHPLRCNTDRILDKIASRKSCDGCNLSPAQLRHCLETKGFRALHHLIKSQWSNSGILRLAAKDQTFLSNTLTDLRVGWWWEQTQSNSMLWQRYEQLRQAVIQQAVIQQAVTQPIPEVETKRAVESDHKPRPIISPAAEAQIRAPQSARATTFVREISPAMTCRALQSMLWLQPEPHSSPRSRALRRQYPFHQRNVLERRSPLEIKTISGDHLRRDVAVQHNQRQSNDPDGRWRLLRRWNERQHVIFRWSSSRTNWRSRQEMIWPKYFDLSLVDFERSGVLFSQDLRAGQLGDQSPIAWWEKSTPPPHGLSLSQNRRKLGYRGGQRTVSGGGILGGTNSTGRKSRKHFLSNCRTMVSFRSVLMTTGE